MRKHYHLSIVNRAWINEQSILCDRLCKMGCVDWVFDQVNGFHQAIVIEGHHNGILAGDDCVASVIDYLSITHFNWLSSQGRMKKALRLSNNLRALVN